MLIQSNPWVIANIVSTDVINDETSETERGITQGKFLPCVITITDPLEEEGVGRPVEVRSGETSSRLGTCD